MELALSLARARVGLTGDNPSVGCVIVKNDKIISIGQTGFNGRPHAEINAINHSFESLVGSKMYVTLEPCNHYGQTPPCTKSIIMSGIDKVYYSITDIDKRVKKKTYKILTKKKILVKKGLLSNKAKDLYDSYIINRNIKLPYVTAKIALSNNNLIYSKGTKRITDNVSDKLSHYLRFKNDAIMISSKTLNTDNPKLNCRLLGCENFSPIRVILDKNLETKSSTYIYKTSNKKNTFIFHNSSNSSKIKLFKSKGINLIKLKLINNTHFDIKMILKKLFNMGVRNLLVEGGDKITKNLLKNRLINRFYLFKSPKNLSLMRENIPFTSFSILNKKYNNKLKIISKLAKDKITIYKR